MIDFDSAPSSSGKGSAAVSDVSFLPTAARPPVTPPAFLNGLNDRQREAALITDGPLIVLAGAGSGKTKMLTSRIAYLMEACGVPGYNILAVTFTNKAAAEMRERVERTLHGSSGNFFGVPEIGTFHSVCVRLLRREMQYLPFTQPFVIYDDSDQLQLLKAVYAKLNLDDKAVNPKAVQGAINRAKCDAIEPEDIDPAPHNLFEKTLKKVYEQYQKDLFANNALDFGEIITLTYKLLRDRQDVREKYQRRFRYIHVDEYQDTNRAQYLLLSQLTKGAHGGHQNICVVGDEDQSIYKWRGADINNILDFERDYPGARVVKLEQNYRSTRNIIKAAGQVIRNNTTRKDKTLWTDNPDGGPIVRMQLADERSEAERAVAEIKRLATGEGRAYGDFAIFYRTNAQSRQFEDVLRREKVPYQIVGGLRFYDRKEIKDILSYFKCVLNPSDSVSLKRIINVPARGIGKTTLDKIDALHALTVDGSTYWDILKRAATDTSITSTGTARKIAGFVTLMDRLMKEQPVLLLTELYHLILDETKYVQTLREEGTEEALARIENLEEFDTLLQEFEEDNFHSIQKEGFTEGEGEGGPSKASLLPLFIEQSSLASDTDKLDGQQSSVKLMTLHSSKGLEFPVVFMAGMEEGLFPSVKQWEEESAEDIEEERRLCYVGMTRAREQLYLMHVSMRRLWGNVNFAEPSRFFEEMPANLLEVRNYAGALSGSGGSYGSRDPWGQSGSRGGRSFDPFDQRVPERPAPTEFRSSRSGLAALQKTKDESGPVGLRMNHPEYGPGTIIACEGSADDRRVTVEFQGRVQRKFLYRYVASYIG